MAAQDKVQQLRQLIHARAAEKQMLQADLEVLDEQELEMLVQNKLITNNILCDTTEGQLVVAGVTLGAAKVLKTAFPGPSAGVGLTGSSGAGAAGGVTEVLQAINELRVTNRHELDIVKKQLQQQQFLMTKTATYSMLGVITALYPQPSQLSGGRDRRFREKLINYYKSNKQGGLMLCTVLGQYVESDAIVAGHLFPTRRAVLAEQFGIRQQDVNNARNGLLWCQCIEYAFELMKVTIAPGPLPGQFTFHVVDDALRNTPLCQHAGECKGSSYLQALEGKTYRDLDGTLLTFPSECPADHRPMERAVLAHFMVSVSLHRGTDSILPAGLQAVVQNCKVHSPMAQQAATLSWLQATCSVQPDTSVESAEAVWHSAPVPLGVGAEGEPDLTWSETEDEE